MPQRPRHAQPRSPAPPQPLHPPRARLHISVHGRRDGQHPVGLLRGPRRWRGTSGVPRGTYLQTLLPSGSSSWAELCTHSHSWRQRMGRALPIPAGHQGPCPGGSPAPHWCPSVPSVPSLLWCGLFLPPALGFFLRKRGRRCPDPDVRGAAGRGSRECCCTGYFWPWLPPYHQKGESRGWAQPHRGVGTCLDISPHSPCAILHRPQSCFSQCPPNPNEASSATPWQGLRGGISTSPMATQPDLCWPLKGCWPLSHLATSPGALCQQMHRKHLFPTQGRLSWGGSGLEAQCSPWPCRN